MIGSPLAKPSNGTEVDNSFEAKNQMSRKNNILRVVKTNILEKNINEN